MLREVMDVLEFLDDARNGAEPFAALLPEGPHSVDITPFESDIGKTDFIKILFPGKSGKSAGGDAPTTGIIGSNGGLRLPGAYPGLASDADGCIVGLASALRLARIHTRGQELAGDVLISTHICQQAHPAPHDPFPFVMSPLPSSEKHPRLVDERMDAILTPETCKGNKMVSHLGFAVTPPVREGFILRPHESILHIAEMVTGKAPVVFPITMQDVTPYELGVHHICGMVLPSIFSTAPVVGVPLVTEIQAHPSATGVQQPMVLESAARFCVEVATSFGNGDCEFHYPGDFEGMVEAFGAVRGWQRLKKDG
ncbi:MAG: DUF1177 family protein [Alphaproteobacteria bacterium]|nr:DUF1177 family protein [Alphaproteobacteria bacterium]